MRLIDADALENCLQALIAHIKEKDGDDAALLTVMQIVKSAPTIGSWISVDDETPEATVEEIGGDLTLSRFVLVYLKYKSGYTFITVDKYRPDMDTWFSEVPGEGCKVTHWMPLPDPPKDENEPTI